MARGDAVDAERKIENRTKHRQNQIVPSQRVAARDRVVEQRVNGGEQRGQKIERRYQVRPEPEIVSSQLIAGIFLSKARLTQGLEISIRRVVISG